MGEAGKQFETAAEQLAKLRRRTTCKTDDLHDLISASHETIMDRMSEINLNFAQVGSATSALEAQICNVANTAVKIGEQLEGIDAQRNRAIEALDLISYFLEFAKGQSVRVPPYSASLVWKLCASETMTENTRPSWLLKSFLQSQRKWTLVQRLPVKTLVFLLLPII